MSFGLSCSRLRSPLCLLVDHMPADDLTPWWYSLGSLSHFLSVCVCVCVCVFVRIERHCWSTLSTTTGTQTRHHILLTTHHLDTHTSLYPHAEQIFRLLRATHIFRLERNRSKPDWHVVNRHNVYHLGCDGFQGSGQHIRLGHCQDTTHRSRPRSVRDSVHSASAVLLRS